MLLNLVKKIKFYTLLYIILWILMGILLWLLLIPAWFDFILIVSYFWRIHIILLLMFVAEEMLLLLVISLTVDKGESVPGYSHVHQALCPSVNIKIRWHMWSATHLIPTAGAPSCNGYNERSTRYKTAVYNRIPYLPRTDYKNKSREKSVASNWEMTFGKKLKTKSSQGAHIPPMPNKSSMKLCLHMMTSSNGNIFRVTGPLCGEFTGHRWIPSTKASDVELWYFLWSAPK